ncbi:MAG: amino acid ABC transporter permease [Desulfovibrio sp.]|nr:amino acid ABC transporter permease [Desulfovibrio sp.]
MLAHKWRLISGRASRLFSGSRFLRLFLAASLAFLIYWLWLRLASEGFQYEWQWNRVWRHFGHFTQAGFVPGPLLEGVLMTLGIAGLGICLATVCGISAAIFRLSPWPACVLVSRVYVTLWRNTPLLLQLFFAYFLVSPLLSLSPFWTAVTALGLFEGAYLAEVFRAGLLGVDRGQWEAALSLGLNVGQAFRLVILPQAIRNMLPALTNQAIALLKDTSLVSAIAVADLTMRSQAIVAETFLAFEVWLLAGAIYLLIALCLALPSLWLERRRRWQ